MMPRFWLRNGWSRAHLIGAVALMGAAIFLTWEAWVDIFLIARKDPESSHIFLVPFIFAWLVWVRRERFRFCYPRGMGWGPLILALGWMIASCGYMSEKSPWWPLYDLTVVSMGRLMDSLVSAAGYSPMFVTELTAPVQAFFHLGSLLVVIGAMVSVLGTDIIRRFLPAFVVLLFLVPVPLVIRQPIAFLLQTYLAEITGAIFSVVGGDIVVQGNLITINGNPVAVAEACNGMRMVFALVLVSFAFAFGTPLRGYVRAIVLVVSPLSALVANVIRMIPTVWLYGKTDQTFFGIEGAKIAHGFHDIAGWIMLVIAFLALMAIIRILQWALIPVTPYTLAYD